VSTTKDTYNKLFYLNLARSNGTDLISAKAESKYCLTCLCKGKGKIKEQFLMRYKSYNGGISIAVSIAVPIAVPIHRLMSYVASNRSQDISKALELALTVGAFMARVAGQPSVLKLRELTEKFVINQQGVVSTKVVIDKPCSAKEIIKRINAFNGEGNYV
jgi:hypothetical protein